MWTALLAVLVLLKRNLSTYFWSHSKWDWPSVGDDTCVQTSFPIIIFQQKLKEAREEIVDKEKTIEEKERRIAVLKSEKEELARGNQVRLVHFLYLDARSWVFPHLL